MSRLPEPLLVSLDGVNGFDHKAFVDVHQSGAQVTSVRINRAKLGEGSEASALPLEEAVPWTTAGYYLQRRPSFTFDPLFHAGCYYVQEASSMFLEQALKQTTDLSQPLRVLDLCAAPGGKSTHLQSLISPDSLLVSNEVIKARTQVLKQNVIKWGSANIVVTNNDPVHFARLSGFFDVMVVDAPCSGSGLFRRDPEAVNEWSEGNVALCSGRQKRILSDALPALKEGGLLVYSTCSYSEEEDEEIGDWLVGEYGMQPLPLAVEERWGIVATAGKSGAPGYRFFPDKVKGEGFFLACFRKTAGEKGGKYRMAKPERASLKEREAVKPWLGSGEVELLKEGLLYALPLALATDYSMVKGALYVQYAGVTVGEVMKDRLVPDHALALSSLLAPGLPKTEVAPDQAIRYLQRADLSVEPAVKGWQLISYQHHNLGWINALQNRINNYYPKEFRILKQGEGPGFEK